MPSFCGVVNCGNRADRDRKSFYRVPAVLNRGTSLKISLCVERRQKWISALKRADLTESKLEYIRICEDHFVTGKPSTVEEKDHPDWVPSKKMGYSSRAAIDDGERYKRRINRKVPLASTSTETADEEMELDDVVPSHQDVAVQTDLGMEDLNIQEQVLQDLQTELVTVKQRLKKMLLDENTFKEDDEKVKYFTGLPTFALLTLVFNLVQPHMKQTHRSVLNNFRQFLLTLMHLRLNLDFMYLGYRFGISNTTASRYFEQCLHVMYQKFNLMVFWPERTELINKVPSSFVDTFGKKAIILIDCFEVKIEKPSNILAAAQCYSHYKHSNTVKYLIGISPQGAIIFISSAWGGRTSDKHIVQNSGLLEKLLPGDLILADRGFNIQDEVELYCAEVKIPAFTKGKKQLSAWEVESTRKLAHLRIHVERVIGQLRQKYRILSDLMPISLVDKNDSVDQIVTVCSALVNLMPSVIRFD